MATFIRTNSEAALLLAGRLQKVMLHLVRLVPGGAQFLLALIATSKEVESTFLAMVRANEGHKAAADALKRSEKKFRAGVFGFIDFVELVFPGFATKLPILSKFDLETSYVTADEVIRMAALFPELQAIGVGLQRQLEEHLRLVDETRAAKRRRETAKATYKSAHLALGTAISEAKKFIHDNAPKDAEFLEQLKPPPKPRPRKPAESTTAATPAGPVKPAAPATADKEPGATDEAA